MINDFNLNKKAQLLNSNIYNVKSRIFDVCNKIGRDLSKIKILAVTKNIDFEIINLLPEDVDFIGENRVQEFLLKSEKYKFAKNRIHFIGHLQTNKVKYIVDKVSMIQSVDSLKLAFEIDKQSGLIGKRMDILLQLNIGKEDTKFGFFEDEIQEAIYRISSKSNLKIRGLMTIPPKFDKSYYFGEMRRIYIDIKEKNIHNISMDYLSMGMSDDYEVAVYYGSNIIRIGKLLFDHLSEF